MSKMGSKHEGFIPPFFAAAGVSGASTFGEEKLHLDASQFKHVVILEFMRLSPHGLAVYHRVTGAFDMSHKVALGAACDHGDLYARLA